MVRRHRRRAGLARAIYAATLSFIAASCLFVAAASAAEQKKWVKGATQTRLSEAINQNTITIVSGNLNATYLSIAYDLSAVLDDGENLRILPLVGKGGGQNIRDVRFMKGVDLGITQSNLLGHFKRTNELGWIDDKIVYIAKLFNEEMHLVVRAEAGITAIEQLAGKTVNFSDIGSGTQLTTRDIFERLGIKVTEVNMGQADAIEKLKTGEIAATVLIAGKPTASMTKLRAADGFRFLPVPFAKKLQDDYLPAALSDDDYPGMVEPGRRIDTIAVGAVLIAYNWWSGSEGYRVIDKFVQAFFSKLPEFQKPPRHPKWREANIAATLTGWTRFAAAQEWLDKNRGKPELATLEQFEQFLIARRFAIPDETPGPEAREKLFQE
ncbi:MAG: TAXI family TRAP transporter solute-binding subunit, partial [Rhizobiales bacterium]|nr:TAXI family TRAP transporter solute-binding subunit [Hyphomicrobiales bacterium]